MSFENYKRMIYFFACGVQDKIPVAKENEDTCKIRELAEKNNVLPAVLYAFLKAKINDENVLENEEQNALKKEMFAYAMHQTKRRHEIKKLIDEFEKENYDVCVIKGDSLEEIYCENAIRTSGDTDLYAGKNVSEKKINEIFRRANFYVLKRPPESHHVMAKSEKGGLVEMHLTLHDSAFEDVWFGNETKPENKYVVKKTHDNFSFKAFEATDEFLFVTMHFIKHFLIGGAGIKQLADVALYVKNKKNEIDFIRVDLLIKKLRYDKFFDVAMSLASDTFMINKNELHFINHYEEDMHLKDEILHDCYIGGAFGSDKQKENKFYEEYTRLRYTKTHTNMEYEKFIKRSRTKNMIKHMILSGEEMKKRYKYVQKSNLLIPVGHLHHAVEIFGKIISGKKKADDYLIKVSNEAGEEVKERIKLIKKLEMI